LRETDTICRLGGNEFIVLLPRLRQPRENAVDVAQKILHSLDEPFLIKGNQIYVKTSIGIALYPDNGEKAEVLVKSANQAMYTAKKEGPDNYQWARPQ
jgi:diguanylate cyclase (GGDEF)-like protein